MGEEKVNLRYERIMWNKIYIKSYRIKDENKVVRIVFEFFLYCYVFVLVVSFFELVIFIMVEKVNFIFIS